MYRLIEATGREHIGQLAAPQTSWNDEGRVRLPHPHDGQAMRRYAEQYEYDGVGQFPAADPPGGQRQAGHAATPTRKRASSSRQKQSNRLSRTSVRRNRTRSTPTTPTAT